MKKLILMGLVLAPAAVFAQLNGSGYYRVQNKATSRFFQMVDNRAWLVTTASTQDINTGAFRLVKGFDEKVVWNPATICYLTKQSQTQYNISGQGLDLYQKVGSFLTFQSRSDGSYIISGEGEVSGTTLSKSLYDSERLDSVALLYTKGASGYQYWYVRPVKSSTNYYFGIKPDFMATMEDNPSRYYTTMYAYFPYIIGNSGLKGYYVTEIKDQYAKVRTLSYSVPAATPVILECKYASPSQNKVDVQAATSSVTGNKLTGVYFCNDVGESTGHRNVVEYKPSTMRVLGKAADGRLAFVTDQSLKYIPANKAYLSVPAGTPATLYVVTEYPTGIENVTVAPVATTRHKGVWTLSGQRLGDSAEGLPKGVYIVDGRKVLVK